METFLLQFRHPGEAPTLDEVRRLFGLAAADLDPDFGVIATDPSECLYSVLINIRAQARVEDALRKRPPDMAEGVFVNPPVEPFEES